MVVIKVYQSALTIEPEVIPLNSKEGEGAKEIYPKSLFIGLIAIGFIVLVIFLKTVLSFSLMIIGLVFLWKQIKNVLSTN